MAALSVHNDGAAFLNSNPLRPHASCNCLLNSWLQLTPPLTVTKSTSYFCAAAIVFVTSTSIIACWNDAQTSAKKATYPSVIGLEESRAEARQLTRQAHNALSVFSSSDAEPLHALANYLLEREY